MYKNRISLDLDGVVYNYSATACYLLNHYRGYDLDWKQTTSWDWLEQQTSNNDWQWLWSAGVSKGLFRYGHLIKGAHEGVIELAKLADIAVVTARPASAIQDTLDWLSFMKFPISELHILGKGKSKAKLLPKFDLAIDDKPENLQEFLDEGVEVIGYVHKYNESSMPDNTIWAYNWKDVVEAAKDVLQ